MSTGTKVIQQALKQIGANSIAQPADPEAIEDGMNTLNSMLQLWESQGIKLGIVPLSVPGDELSEPFDATQAITDNLSLALAPLFDNGAVIVSPRLEMNAKGGYESVKSLYQVLPIPKKTASSTLPLGQGNNINRRHTPFAGKDYEIA